MKRFKMTQEEYEKVRATLKTNTDRNAERRLKVLMLRHEGHKLAEISEMTGDKLMKDGFSLHTEQRTAYIILYKSAK